MDKKDTYKFYKGEETCPYKDFYKAYLWEAERMAKTQPKAETQKVLQTFLDEAYDVIDIRPDVSLTLRAYIYNVCMHISQKTAVGYENADSLIQTALQQYKVFIARYEK